MAEECDMPGKVRNIVTLGGPHMGVDGVPKIGEYNNPISHLINYVIGKVVYHEIVQNLIAPAGYYRNEKDMPEYLRNSVFLPALNNEQQTGSTIEALRKQNFSKINKAMFVKFSEDSVIVPKETAWF